MDKYQCHKIVEAAVINSVDNGQHNDNVHGVWIKPNNEWVELNKEFFARGIPSKGDYLVKYENDYFSWSPKDVFEKGYTKIEE